MLKKLNKFHLILSYRFKVFKKLNNTSQLIFIKIMILPKIMIIMILYKIMILPNKLLINKKYKSKITKAMYKFLQIYKDLNQINNKIYKKIIVKEVVYIKTQVFNKCTLQLKVKRKVSNLLLIKLVIKCRQQNNKMRPGPI